MLKTVNVTWPYGHGLAEGNLIPRVVSRPAHKFPCDMAELLRGCCHMDPLVQKFSHFLFGQAILSHRQEDLDMYRALL